MDWLKNPKLDVAIVILLLLSWYGSLIIAWHTGGTMWYYTAFPLLAMYPLSLIIDFLAWIAIPVVAAVAVLWEEILEL